MAKVYVAKVYVNKLHKLNTICFIHKNYYQLWHLVVIGKNVLKCFSLLNTMLCQLIFLVRKYF